MEKYKGTGIVCKIESDLHIWRDHEISGGFCAG